MYAIILTGGKQYKVEQGQYLKVEKLDAELGDSVKIDKILMVADGSDVKLGQPYIEGASVNATIKSHGRHKKIKIIKFRRRKHSRTQMGHRQYYTELTIDSISA